MSTVDGSGDRICLRKVVPLLDTSSSKRVFPPWIASEEGGDSVEARGEVREEKSEGIHGIEGEVANPHTLRPPKHARVEAAVLHHLRRGALDQLDGGINKSLRGAEPVDADRQLVFRPSRPNVEQHPPLRLPIQRLVDHRRLDIEADWPRPGQVSQHLDARLLGMGEVGDDGRQLPKRKLTGLLPLMHAGELLPEDSEHARVAVRESVGGMVDREHLADSGDDQWHAVDVGDVLEAAEAAQCERAHRNELGDTCPIRCRSGAAAPLRLLQLLLVWLARAGPARDRVVDEDAAGRLPDPPQKLVEDAARLAFERPHLLGLVAAGPLSEEAELGGRRAGTGDERLSLVWAGGAVGSARLSGELERCRLLALGDHFFSGEAGTVRYSPKILYHSSGRIILSKATRAASSPFVARSATSRMCKRTISVSSVCAGAAVTSYLSRIHR